MTVSTTINLRKFPRLSMRDPDVEILVEPMR